MAKFTVIYPVPVGRPGQTTTCYKRIETENLIETMDKDFNGGDVWFVFNGWPLERGEFSTGDPDTQGEEAIS